jgi:hypothetical protein
MHLLGRLGRLALLLATLVIAAAAIPAISGAQSQQAQCSDGIDNDSDNAVDGGDAGCAGGEDDDETDSPYAGVVTVTRALPVVTLQGTVDRRGTVNVAKLLFRADRGTGIDIACKGKRCPFKKLHRTMITTSLRLKKMERKLRPPMVLRMRVGLPGQLGKYVKYKVRRRKAPLRVDSCLDPVTRKVRGCFTG